MEGFLLIDKPQGMTSHDVVNHVRQLLHTYLGTAHIPKVGHAGTLDPLATGLLIVGIGKATRALGKVLGFPKTYEAEIVLGATSSTDDAEGTLQEMRRGHPAGEDALPRARVEEVLKKFTGEIAQVPPAYSAVKMRGVPAHRRVRRGESVTLPPRTVTVYDATLLSYDFPLVRVRWTVSSGTYIRSLARDAGAYLQTGAYLFALRRTAIGTLRVTDAQTLEHLSLRSLYAINDIVHTRAA